MADADGFDEGAGLAAQAAALEASLNGVRDVAAAFEAELSRMRGSLVLTSREVSTLSSSLSNAIGGAFDGVVFEGMKFSDALKSVAQSLSETVYRIAMKPVEDAVGGAVASGLNGLLGGLFPFARGGVVADGATRAFARGGVVDRPVTFPMRGGTGLAGEAGPEAILPLARGRDGRLGVQAGGGGRGVNVTVNISTPDARSFERSRGQIAAQMARIVARGDRNA